MIKPCGYYVLVKMEQVEQVTESGIVIATNLENQREQAGHDIGTLVSLGPTAFSGFQGVEGHDALQRAHEWGVDIGDKVEFTRYDGKIPSHPDYKDYRIIQDAHLIGVIED
jgi:co-chaperonin GroES (HSP10)